jgi:hypothetical protein
VPKPSAEKVFARFSTRRFGVGEDDDARVVGKLANEIVQVLILFVISRFDEALGDGLVRRELAVGGAFSDENLLHVFLVS